MSPYVCFFVSRVCLRQYTQCLRNLSVVNGRSGIPCARCVLAHHYLPEQTKMRRLCDRQRSTAGSGNLRLKASVAALLSLGPPHLSQHSATFRCAPHRGITAPRRRPRSALREPLPNRASAPRQRHIARRGPDRHEAVHHCTIWPFAPDGLRRTASARPSYHMRTSPSLRCLGPFAHAHVSLQLILCLSLLSHEDPGTLLCVDDSWLVHRHHYAMRPPLVRCLCL